jgi:putative two-component system response regulator
MTHHDAVNVIVHGRDTHFDPLLVDTFTLVADEFEVIAKTTVQKNYSFMPKQ